MVTYISAPVPGSPGVDRFGRTHARATAGEPINGALDAPTKLALLENHVHPVVGAVERLTRETARSVEVDAIRPIDTASQGMQRRTVDTRRGEEQARICVLTGIRVIGGHIGRVRRNGYGRGEINRLPS